jgi:hypothetical protein
MVRYDEPNRRVEKLEMRNQEMAERFRDAFGEGVVEVKKERGEYITVDLKILLKVDRKIFREGKRSSKR